MKHSFEYDTSVLKGIRATIVKGILFCPITGFSGFEQTDDTYVTIMVGPRSCGLLLVGSLKQFGRSLRVGLYNGEIRRFDQRILDLTN